VVSDPIGREKVHFEAPPASALPAETAAFLRWFNGSVQLLALDGTGGDDFLREGLQASLVALCQPQLGHAAHEVALGAVYLGQRRSQRGAVELPVWPVGALPDVAAVAGWFFSQHAVIMELIRRKLCGE